VTSRKAAWSSPRWWRHSTPSGDHVHRMELVGSLLLLPSRPFAEPFPFTCNNKKFNLTSLLWKIKIKIILFLSHFCHHAEWTCPHSIVLSSCGISLSSLWFYYHLGLACPNSMVLSLYGISLS
jgi:hypothetical protein